MMNLNTSKLDTVIMVAYDRLQTEMTREARAKYAELLWKIVDAATLQGTLRLGNNRAKWLDRANELNVLALTHWDARYSE